MDDLFLILFLLSFFCLIIGLIKPSVLSRIFRREITRKKAGLIFTSLIFVFFLLFGLTIPPKEFLKENLPATILQTEKQNTEELSELKDGLTPESETQTTPEQEQSYESTANQVKSSESVETYLVKRVIDGDTIELENGQKVRYIGIDTPETVHPSKPVECFGKEASNKNKELVGGKMVKLEKDISETDRYGRLLRYVWVDNIFINDYLVRQGYAQVSTYPPDVKYSNQFLQAQQEARNNNRGLWGDCQSVSSQEQTKDEPITEQPKAEEPKTQESSTEEKWYTSSYRTAKYYYHESCQGWQGLSPKYLQSFDSEAELLSKYNRTLHWDCNP